MKFGGTFQGNFMNATGSQSKDYAKQVLLDEVARLIEFNKQSVISALNDSGHKVSPDASKKTVIDHTAKALYENSDFRNIIAKQIATGGKGYSNTVGADALQQAKGGSASGAGAGLGAVGAIAGALGSLFGAIGASQNNKAEQERTRQDLYNKLLTDNQKTNWTPIIVVGGVFLLSGIVLFLTLRK